MVFNHVINRPRSKVISLTPSVLIGTYTQGYAARGLYDCAVNAQGVLQVRDCLELEDPSFVIGHPRYPLFYVVNEIPGRAGKISIVRRDNQKQRLQLVEQVSSGGESPCHLALLADADWLGVANYNSGHVELLGLNERGLLDGRRQQFAHQGSSAHPRRQVSAHPHHLVWDVHRERLYVTDLGIDRIESYALDRDRWQPTGSVKVTAGEGPRHLKLSKNGRFAYISLEMGNALIAADLAERDWVLGSSVSTLPVGSQLRSYVSEVALHPNQNIAYVGNRGDDSIAVMRVRGAAVELIKTVSCQGKHPRHFALSPNRDRLLVANRDSNNVVAFSVSPDGEGLEMVGISDIPAPVCICWE